MANPFFTNVLKAFGALEKDSPPKKPNERQPPKLAPAKSERRSKRRDND